eukprot:4403662-Alexandrium_andersonii.AAC.1
MSASLVGSEMCIRDRVWGSTRSACRELSRWGRIEATTEPVVLGVGQDTQQTAIATRDRDRQQEM